MRMSPRLFLKTAGVPAGLPLAIGLLLAIVLLPIMTLLAPAASAETIQVPISNEPVFGNPGSVIQLGQAEVPTALQGRSCAVQIVVRNQESENAGNRLVVSSGASQVVLDGIEDTANSVTSGSGTLVLGPSIDVSVVLGGGASSAEMSVSCETTPKPTVQPTVQSTTNTTQPDKSHIPVSCSPDSVPVGGELTIVGGRTDGFGYKPGEALQVRVDGNEVAATTVRDNGLFSVTFTVDLEPGTYLFEAISLGAKGEDSCAIVELPVISVAPTSGPEGSSAVVSGTGYAAGDVVDISFGELVFASNIEVDDDGTFSATAEVPGLVPRSHPIVATRDREPEAASVEYLITDKPKVPVIMVDPGSGEPGSSVTVSGTRYDPGDVVDIFFGDVEFASNVTVDDDGEFSAPGQVPPLDPGPYVVTASRSRDPEAAEIAFTVNPIVGVPTIRVSPASGEVGSSATVSGSDYQPGDIVDVGFGGSPFASDVVVGDDGEFSATGIVPDVPTGLALVSATRDNPPQAADVSFNVTGITNGCTKWLGICWWWWFVILLLLLLLLWLILFLMCKLRYPFHPGEPIKGSGWIAEEGDCKLRQGLAVPARAGGCAGDGCSCELFRRKMFGSDGCWEHVASRQERLSYCYRAACAREEGVPQSAP